MTPDKPAIDADGVNCTSTQRNFLGFDREVPLGAGGTQQLFRQLASECPRQARPGDGAYLGWANADGSVIIGSVVSAGHERFGVFRDGKFTSLPPLPVSVSVPAGVLNGAVAW